MLPRVGYPAGRVDTPRQASPDTSSREEGPGTEVCVRPPAVFRCSAVHLFHPGASPSLLLPRGLVLNVSSTTNIGTSTRVVS